MLLSIFCEYYQAKKLLASLRKFGKVTSPERRSVKHK